MSSSNQKAKTIRTTKVSRNPLPRFPVSVRQLNEYKNFVHSLFDHNRTIVSKYFNRNIPVDLKQDRSPVTRADREIEERMRTAIQRHYPGHSVVGEEFGADDKGSEMSWLLDPIDGTKSFICGVPTFSTLVALMYQGQPVLGALHLPVFNEVVIGDPGGTTLNGRRVRIRPCRRVRDAVALVTDPIDIQKKFGGSGLDALYRQVKLYRYFGDGYGYYLVVTGRADVMIDAVMAPWDLIPLIPIIRGAGGIISGYSGQDPLDAGSSVAASRELHPEIIKILSSRPEDS